MKRSPLILSALTGAGGAATITILIFALLAFTGVEFGFWLPIAVFFLSFAALWLLFHWVLKQFIVRRIKAIYKNMDGLSKSKAPYRYSTRRDVLGDVNRQVIDWAEDRMAEIQDLRQKENFRKEFVGNVAHELKTPIFSIQGYILTLLEGALEDPKFNRKFLNKAAKSAERMTRIVEDLDTITQFESGNLKLKIEKIDLVELTREIIESREQEADQREIEVTFDQSYDAPIYAMADSFRISQVLTNLITNSINYGREKGQTLVRFVDLGDRWRVEIEDNGPGITKEHIPRLFERFYRVDKSRTRDQGGTGLGLAICKHIMEAHKETLTVQSTPGKGSIFAFTLKKAK